MTSIVYLLITILVFTTVQTEVYTTYINADYCVDDIVNQVKANQKDLATDFCLSNQQASNSLRDICTYYVQDDIHKVLRAVKGVTCLTEVKIPTINELSNVIYDAYLTILKQLSTYAETPSMIPDSLGQFNDYIVGRTKAVFSSTASKVAGLCLQKEVKDIN